MLLEKVQRPLRIVDQWTYHTRVLDAAALAAKKQELEFVGLNSFGCGLDSIVTDQTEEIIRGAGKLYTLVKIDEIDNLGAVRIRIRSLKAAIKERKDNGFRSHKKGYTFHNPQFTKGMKKGHTLLSAQMSPVHFELLESVFHYRGYQLKVLPTVTREDIEEGLKYVNNDACYPCIIVVGQLINALKSGRYDLKKTSLIMSQTGGGCRATNYISLLRKALVDAGFPDIPVISFNFAGLDKQPGFSVDYPFFKRLIAGVFYGDLLFRLVNRVRPYERIKGSTNLLYNVWVKKCKESLRRARFKDFKENVRAMVGDFEFLKIDEKLVKPRVGVVGEILVKLHPQANNNLLELLEGEGAEAVVTGIADFILYCAFDALVNHKLLAGSKKKAIISAIIIKYIESYQNEVKKALNGSVRFDSVHSISDMAKKASQILALGNNTGEGWLLTADMIELIEAGVDNIVCTQPFGCLPNHVTGKGMLKELKNRYPHVNIVSVDYDPGASEVNQLNRIKLMLSTAFDKLQEGMANEIEKDILDKLNG